MSTYEVKVWKIEDVKHHPNADRLDIARCGGWECIVGRDEFVVGDSVIFVPPDSLVTDDFVKEFNITYLKGKGKNRIGAVKLRGEWSEGLIVPNVENFKVGTNVADFYEIEKYEPIEPSLPGGKGGRRGEKYIRAKMRLYGGLFPRYTTIENVKNFQNVLEVGEPVIITEKIHGTNFRVGYAPMQGGKPYKLLMKIFGKSHQFLIGSHNVILDHKISTKTFYGDNVYSKMANSLHLNEIIPEDYILYGEIFGRNTNGKEIQKGYSYGLNRLDVRFFDVAYKREYLSPSDAVRFLTSIGLPYVPLLYIGPWDLKLISKYTNGMSTLDEYTLQEGFVVQPLEPRKDKNLGRVILKAISQAYLAQKERTEGH